MIPGRLFRGVLLLTLTSGFAAAQEFPYSLSYVLQTNPNVVVLQDGGTLLFAPTRVSSTAQAVLSLTNTGNQSGTVTSLSITGTSFGFAAIPVTPLTLESRQVLQLPILFRPMEVGGHSGEVTFTLGPGPPITVKLSGFGTAPGFLYEILSDPITTVSPGGLVEFAGADVGKVSTLEIRVTNSGSADGVVGALAVSGQGFLLANSPALPQTLEPGGSVTFAVSFAPTQAGTMTGRLSIDSAVFDLRGQGLGAQLEYSYTAGSVTVPLTSTNTTVVFSPVTITESRDVTFTVRNTGTIAAVFSNIGTDPVNGPFTVKNLPALPFSVDPGSSLSATVTFAPTTLGFASGTLRLDSTAIPLLGSGTTPPPLPAYTIVGPSGITPPSIQQNVGITLESPYPVALSGSLVLTVAGELSADPAVQFASGGRTVAFTIPASATNAVFAGQGTQIGLQTGTVADVMTLTPSFATQAGNVDLTPSAPPTLQFSVAPAPPTLIAAQILNPTASSFTLSVTGYTTSRSLTEWRVQFTPAEGVDVPTTEFTINVAPVATSWFRGTTSQTFGGQFTISVPFTFQGTLGTDRSVLSAVSSVSATMSNGLGSSNTLQVSTQ